MSEEPEFVDAEDEDAAFGGEPDLCEECGEELRPGQQSFMCDRCQYDKEI